MDQRLRPELDAIKRMSSSDAANYLLERYPRESSAWWDGAMKLIPHRSWKVSDQLRLAEQCFALHAPFASPQPYDTFAAFMSLENFLHIMRKHAANDPARWDLLRYHLSGVLRVYQSTETNRRHIAEFLRETA